MMRTYLAGCAGVLGFLAPLLAVDPEPQMARIARPEGEVRGGPSEKYPITLRLHVNDPVYVRGPAANPGWLEIVPPAGSFDWIPDRIVQQVPNAPNTLFVLGDEVPLRIGAAGSLLPLDFEAKVKVKRGTQLTVRGEKVVHEKAGWWPVAPPTGDARYILADSVAAAPAAGAISASAKPGMGSEPPAAPMPTTSNEPKEWQAALRAEKEGRYEDAYRIYSSLAQQHRGPGGDFAMLGRCETRKRELIDGGFVKATLVSAPKANIPGVGSPAVRTGSSPVGSNNPSAPPP